MGRISGLSLAACTVFCQKLSTFQADWPWFSWAGPCGGHGETEAQREDALLGITESQGRQVLLSFYGCTCWPRGFSGLPEGLAWVWTLTGECGPRATIISSTAGDWGKAGALSLRTQPGSSWARGCPLHTILLGPFSLSLLGTQFLCSDRDPGLDPPVLVLKGPAPHRHWPAPFHR